MVLLMLLTSSVDVAETEAWCFLDLSSNRTCRESESLHVDPDGLEVEDLGRSEPAGSIVMCGRDASHWHEEESGNG